MLEAAHDIEATPDPLSDIAARETWRAKVRRSLVKRGKVAADVLAEMNVLDLAPLMPVETLTGAGVWLHAQAFTSTGRARLWSGVLREAAAGVEIDLFAAAAGDDDARAAAVEVQTLTMYPIPARFELYAREVAKWHAYREAAAQAGKALDTTGCTSDEALARLRDISVTMPATAPEAAAQAVASAADLARDAMADYLSPQDETAALSTTLPNLDAALDGGLRSDRPTVIGAPTGVGKTALAMQIALAAAQTVPVYVLNAESTRRAWRQRALSHLGQINLSDVLNRRADLYEINLAAEALDALHLHLDDGRVDDGRANLDVHHVCERILTQHRRSPLGLVVIDYITKLTIRERFERPDLRVGAISDRLAALCKQLGCPVLVLSQLNDLEPGRPPRRSNIAESRKVAHDAGAVLMLWRPDPAVPDEMEILVEKAALSAESRVPVRFLGAIQRFEPREADPQRSSTSQSVRVYRPRSERTWGDDD